MNAEGYLAGASALSRPAEEYENDASVEGLWVVKACEYADIHLNLISSADPRLLRLTKDDDRIYGLFLQMFPKLHTDVMTEEVLKSETAKQKWREFYDLLKDIEDYGFGTLLRLNANEEYTEENSILVSKVQFLAIEIDRNRKGFNNHIWNLKCKTTKAQ